MLKALQITYSYPSITISLPCKCSAASHFATFSNVR